MTNFFTILLCLLSCSSFGQKEEQLLSLHFDVEFAQKTNYKQDSVYLRANVYQPQSQGLKPLLIFLHGGGFVIGDKSSSVSSSLCFALAKENVVCASINYRLGFGKNGDKSEEGVKTVLRAMEDLHEAIIFFKQSAQIKKYQIDTNQIYIGGSSAGGITALHYAYMDQEELWEIVGEGFETDVNTKQLFDHKQAVKGVLSFCGGISNLSFVDDEIKTLLAHGNLDEFVPYNEGYPHPPRFLPGFTRIPKTYIYGSAAIYEVLKSQGADVVFKTFKDKGHIPYEPPLHPKTYIPYLNQLVRLSRDFIYPLKAGADQNFIGEFTVIEQQKQFVIYLPDRTQDKIELTFLDDSGEELKKVKLQRKHPFFLFPKEEFIPYTKIRIKSSRYNSELDLKKDVIKW